MLLISLNLPDIERVVNDEIVRANDVAVAAAASAGISALRSNMPVKSGRLLTQTQIKYFRERSGMMAASLRVVGDRYFLSRILEGGAASHGGRPKMNGKAKAKRVKPGGRGDRGPIAARHMFRRTWDAVHSQISSIYTDTFLGRFNP